MKLTNILVEAGLNRLYSHMSNYDCGIITAFRYARECGNGKLYTKQENLKRNRSLLAKLFDKRYDVISIKGSYIENYGSDSAIEVSEESFFVFDMNNKQSLLNDLLLLGEEFNQDSIAFIPKGGQSLILHGTNTCVDSFPGYNKTKKYNIRQLGKKSQFFAKVKNRPFSYISEISDHIKPQGFMGRMGCNGIANMNWEDIDID